MRELLVDLAAIRHNLRVVAERVAPAGIVAVVKADAYGHGLLPVARAAEQAGVAMLGVADLGEAMALRTAGIRTPVLSWLHGPDADLAAAVAAQVELGIGSLELLDRLAASLAPAAGPAVVHLKVDTGLGRGGAVAADWPRLVARAVELQGAGAVRVRGIWSHLANASPEADRAQFAAFDAALELARGAGLEPELRHIAASAAMLAHPDQRHELVRVGIAMYGVSPFGLEPCGLELRPAMELAGTIIQLKRVPAGHGVSYGHRHVTSAATTLALLPLGYADGLPRAASGAASVAIRGRRYPVVGTIAMDQVVVDVGEDEVAVGDRAVVWGDPATGAPSVEDWAAAAGTIGYELLTKVGPRVPRRYLDA